MKHIVRGEPSYYYMELLYRRHPSVRPRSSIRPRPRSRQPRFGSRLDNAFQHLRSRGRQRSQRGMPTCASVLPAVYRAGLRPAFIHIDIHSFGFRFIHSEAFPYFILRSLLISILSLPLVCSFMEYQAGFTVQQSVFSLSN